MSGVDEVIRKRRSIRRFRAEVPSEELIRELVQLATWAPSAMNRQDWAFTVVRSGATRDRMVECVRSEWERLASGSELLAESLLAYAGSFVAFGEAPVLVAVSARRPPSFLQEAFGPAAERLFGSAAGAAMAVQNLALAAHARGLGTCVFTAPVAAEKALSSLLGLGRSHSLLCLLALGFPAEEPSPRPRKPLEETLRFFEE